MHPSRSLSALSRLPLLLLALAPLAASSACGAPAAERGTSDPFTAQFPDEGPGTPRTPLPPLPPPTFPVEPVWRPDAVDLERTALFGSFPSDLDRFEDTLFVNDADAVEGDGARILALDVSGTVPIPSGRHRTVVVHASDLVDSLGAPGDVSVPIAFGFFLNDLRVVSDHLGFVLANAGGSDSVPTCSNLVVFDPETGDLRQVVDLANTFSPGGALLDSSGAPVPGGAFTQAGAEGVEYVPTTGGKGLLFVAMSNFVIGPPSYGAIKYPGTVQVFDVDPLRPAPVSLRVGGGHATQTLWTRDYNPVAVTRFTPHDGPERLLVTCAGTTGYDASFRLVPVTPASVQAFDGSSLSLLGTFDLGLAGLSGIRPALGRDAVGHAVAFFASSVLGEVYLLRLDGIDEAHVDPTAVAVLRGPANGIAIEPGSAGGPGGNVSGLALSGDGRTLLASGFGDLFAFGGPTPGRLFALSLPDDVVAGSTFGRAFVPGTASLATTPGRTLGPVLIAAGNPSGPEVFVTVGGPLDLGTFLGSGPASLGTLSTFGRIR